MSVADSPWPWAGAGVADPRDWVLSSSEPAANWLLLAVAEGRGEEDPDVAEARARVLADPATAQLMVRLPDWEGGAAFSGHNSPAFAPNLLNLLADMGIRGGDEPRIERMLDAMLLHSDPDGRFQSLAPVRSGQEPVWGALLCDTHAITEVLVRFGRGEDPRVRAALDRMSTDLAPTTQGTAWPCRQDPVTGFRGPGRRGDLCPQVTVEAIRTFGRVPPDRRPPQLHEVARVLLSTWRDRGRNTPYMFGHGRSFKTGKWPGTWYSALTVLEALSGHPGLWEDPGADPAERRLVAELVACLIAYTMDAEGRVRPLSTFRGFEAFSFGQKKLASPFATAKVLSVLAPFAGLAGEVSQVEVLALTSSRGGNGTVQPPRTGSALTPRAG